MANISVIGSGSWGTAIAVMLAQMGHNVRLWSHRAEQAKLLQNTRENIRLLPGVFIPENVQFTAAIGDCKDADLVICAVPSHAVGQTAEKLRPYLKSGQIVLNVSKGLEDKTHATLSGVLRRELPECEIAVMSGPSHAEEVARGIPTTNVVAAKREETANRIQDMVMNKRFRVYTNPDILGVELGGALKNVIALAAGILDGMGLGDNAKAALMTRGIVEMARLGVALGAKEETFHGLSGIGDLMVTCTSRHSRNRRAGVLIGQGKSKDEAVLEVGMVVEGVKTCSAAYELARKSGVEMPITEQIYRVLYQGKAPADAVRDLMAREKKHETEQAFLF